MINSINNSMQNMQTQAMGQAQGMHNGQGMGKGKGLGQIMRALPQDMREQVRNTLQSLDETQRKDMVSQLKQLDVANLSQDQLLQEVQNILNPTTSAYNFSVYA